MSALWVLSRRDGARLPIHPERWDEVHYGSRDEAAHHFGALLGFDWNRCIVMQPDGTLTRKPGAMASWLDRAGYDLHDTEHCHDHPCLRHQQWRDGLAEMRAEEYP